MKKQICTTLLIVFCCYISTAQKRPFEDALHIMGNLDNGDELKNTLRPYMSNDNYLSFLEKNPFLKHCLKLCSNLNTQKQGNLVNTAQNANSSFGFIPQKEAIDALGTFIAERFKQEINAAYLNKFKAMLKSDTLLIKMFPATQKFIEVNEPYNYPTFMAGFKAAMKKDFNTTPQNLYTLFKEQSIQSKIDQNKYTFLIMALSALSGYSEKHSAAQIIVEVTDPKNNAATNADLRRAINLLHAFFDEITDDQTKDWYSKDNLEQIFGKPTEEGALVFFGLFYEKYKDLLKVNLDEKLLPKYIERLYSSVKLINDYLKKIESIKEMRSELSKDEVMQYAILVVNLIDNGIKSGALYGAIDSKITNNFAAFGQQGINIVSAIYDKDYADAMLESFSLITNLVPDSYANKAAFVKYGNFALSIVTAEDAAAMGKALETAALPVGSYRIKRNAIFNISLNAYAGAFGGAEFLSNRGNDGTFPAGVKKTAGLAGFSAPLGIAFSFGSTAATSKDMNLRRYKSDGKERVFTGYSWSIFITALDLGAVTAFRLTNDKTDELPDVKFKNIITPGAYLIWGIKGSPLSIGLGGQLGPQLRKIEDFDNVKNIVSAWSTRCFIAADIPLFNFYTKSDKSNKQVKSDK